jgi:hypothetical protein
VDRKWTARAGLEIGAAEADNRTPARFAPATEEIVMAKGQMRSNKEKKKPKAEWNKKKKGAQAQSPFSQGSAQPGANPYGKKGP